MKDLLQEATRALREETAPESSATTRRRDRQTRARIQDDLRRPPSRMRSGFFAVPMAAILIGSTAWASGALPRIVDALTEARRTTSPPAPAEKGIAPPPTPVAPAPARLVPDMVDPDEEAEAEKPPVASPVKSAVAVASASPPAPLVPPAPPRPAATSTPEPEPEQDRSIALYRAAHQAHFGGEGPAAALRYWNTYLAEAPGGRFAPEAAFNRAICLVRLGRHQAAIAALTPFATGSFGAYRQSEAKQLITALEKKR